MPRKPHVGRPRPAARQSGVTQRLRALITTNRWGPGLRIPTQAELIRKLGVSGVTVQRAIAELVRDGMIETRGRRGTFVVERPPHLWEFGLVLTAENQAGNTRFTRALVAAAERLNVRGGPRVHVHRIWPHPPHTVDVSLMNDVSQGRLAGLILVSTHLLVGSALVNLDVDALAVPRVTVVPKPWPPGLPAVFPDLCAMVRLMLDEVASRGSRRVAAFLTPAMYGICAAELRDVARARGLELPEHWIQIIAHQPPDAARNAAMLMMQAPVSRRPQSLLVLDDNLVESVTAGLLQAGVGRSGGGPTPAILAHANFPHAGVNVLPVQHIGFAADRILATCLDAIGMLRRGKRPPAMTLVRPQREEEESDPSANGWP